LSVVGTTAVLAGVIIVLLNYGDEDEYFTAALLIFGGLLLRIEAALRRGWPTRPRE